MSRGTRPDPVRQSRHTNFSAIGHLHGAQVRNPSIGKAAGDPVVTAITGHISRTATLVPGDAGVIERRDLIVKHEVPLALPICWASSKSPFIFQTGRDAFTKRTTVQRGLASALSPKLIIASDVPTSMGSSKEGLLIGLQTVGAEFNDYATIEFARLMTRKLGVFVPRPDFP